MFKCSHRRIALSSIAILIGIVPQKWFLRIPRFTRFVSSLMRLLSFPVSSASWSSNRLSLWILLISSGIFPEIEQEKMRRSIKFLRFLRSEGSFPFQLFFCVYNSISWVQRPSSEGKLSWSKLVSNRVNIKDPRFPISDGRLPVNWFSLTWKSFRFLNFSILVLLIQSNRSQRNSAVAREWHPTICLEWFQSKSFHEGLNLSNLFILAYSAGMVPSNSL